MLILFGVVAWALCALFAWALCIVAGDSDAR